MLVRAMWNMCGCVMEMMGPEMCIGNIQKDGWKHIGTGEICIDSAAEESVCPEEWEKEFGTAPIKPGKEMRFRNASGGKMNHYGARAVTFTAKDANPDTMMGLEFQVSDVKKPLVAVWRIAEKGNIVQFGPTEEQCFIQNIRTKEKVGLRRKGGS